MTSADKLKQAVRATVDETAPELIGISDWMYTNPEIGLQEVKASERLTALLESGTNVERESRGCRPPFARG